MDSITGSMVSYHRNAGFLSTGMAVSKSPDTGVTGPGILTMTEEERKVLHEWVSAGYSVHENGSMVTYEGGRPVDFPDVCREEEEIRRTLDAMTYEEGSKYLLEEYGIDRDGVMTPKPPTYEELKKKANRLYRTCLLYREVLVYEYVREHIDEEWPFDSFDRDIAQ